MKLQALKTPIPQCRIAKHIRCSVLYKKSGSKVEKDNSLRIYPLPITYIRHSNDSFSLFYLKNNVINYYIYNKDALNYNVIPLYNYKTNQYDLLITDYPYDFSDKSAEEMVVVRTPNNKYYIVGIVKQYQNLEDALIILNVKSGLLVYSCKSQLRGLVNRMRHSMPIANSFVIVFTTSPKQIIIHVIDLINEKVDKIVYSLEQYKTQRSYLNKNSKIKYIDIVNFGHKISKDNSGTVFYQQYYLDIRLEADRRLAGEIAFTAIYQNRELEIVLKVSEDTSIVRRYSVDAKLDFSPSHLYSVIISSDEYTLVRDTRVSYHIELYYKSVSQESYININADLRINWYEDFSIIEAGSKYFIMFNKVKDHKILTNKWHHVLLEDRKIKVFSLHQIPNLMSRMSDSNPYNIIVFDEKTEIVKEIQLNRLLKDLVALNLEKYLEDKCNPNPESIVAKIDSETNKFYILFWAFCTSLKKHYFSLLECNINDVLKGANYFKLMWLFGVKDSTNFYDHDISYKFNIKRLYAYTKIKHSYFAECLLTMFTHSIDKTSKIYDDIVLGGFYENSNYYYDLRLNRKSIKITNIFIQDSDPIICRLKLTKKVIPV